MKPPAKKKIFSIFEAIRQFGLEFSCIMQIPTAETPAFYFACDATKAYSFA